MFTFSGASAALVQLVVSMNLNKTLFCLVVAIILLIFGTFMEGTAIAVLLVPVLWPIAESMGINVIHFGMILCISNVIGNHDSSCGCQHLLGCAGHPLCA